jgi:hypothetical protein
VQPVRGPVRSWRSRKSSTTSRAASTWDVCVARATPALLPRVRLLVEGSLLPCIALHAANNALVLSVSLDGA